MIKHFARLLSLPIFFILGANAFSAYAAADIDNFLDPRGTIDASISPDGKHISAVIFNGTNYGLALIDTETMSSRTIVTGKRVTEGFWRFNKRPYKSTWITNDIIAVDYGIEAETINLNGVKLADIGVKILRKAESKNPDSKKILVYTDSDATEVALVDGKSGEREKFRFPMSGKPIYWAFDKAGQLRAMTLANSSFWKDVNSVTNWYKSKTSNEWEKLAEFKIADEYWIPVYVPDEENSLVVSSRIGRDTYAIFEYDTKRREIKEMLAGHPSQDILSVDGITNNEFNRIVTEGLIPQQVWLEPRWAQVQASVDAALPKKINVISGDPLNKILIFSYSDKDPGTWLLLDAKKSNLMAFAKKKPSINPDLMRPMETVHYLSNDGVKIPAYLTRPNDLKSKAPAIILIHGGPRVRDRWLWDQEVQFFAAHGYVVFQPQFRGSSGFGRKFEEAGFGQWGRSMQDDITAGVNYLIRDNIADPQRICIYGASYGGYAALWGLVKTPDLFQCGVSFAGVSDIEFMLTDSSDRNDSKITRELMRTHVGDLRQDKNKFDEVSPLKNVAKIKAPVLLAHGEEDERVPIAHGKKMRNALRDQKKSVEWISFEDEGHDLNFIRNQRLFLNRILEFFDEHTKSKKVDYIDTKLATPATSE
ncbi:MAG: S9 family peptidase [Burkholderiaceae bacterium]|nr:S9 family peptidase [Burkholderiaceae bacterium]